MYLLKPDKPIYRDINKKDLHSTMYLLKQAEKSGGCDYYLFTFHYVSIKTDDETSNGMDGYAFTFHYVSIKTMLRQFSNNMKEVFTFHYVSIKTRGLK